MNARLGKPVVDELRLCYTAEPLLLEELSGVEMGGSISITPFILFRVCGDRYEYMFKVCLGDIGAREEVATLKYGRYGAEHTQYVFFRVNNQVLYDVEKLRMTLLLPEMMGMYFNNFTALDIALDFNKNISSIIKRMIRNRRIKTIYNGKLQKDPNYILAGVNFNFATSLSRLYYPSITLHQAKARKKKEKGITVQSYDKRAEILTSSGKDYILNYYGNPKRLYRLEVRLHYQELQDYSKRMGRPQAVEMIFEPAYLEGAFYYHLSSVLRFTIGRRKISWQEIIACNGRV